MKHCLLRTLSVLLSLLFVLPAALMPVLCADMTQTEDGRTTVELKTSSGESTGVSLTTIHFPKAAGATSNSHVRGKQVTVVEADLSNPHISMRPMSNYNGSSILNTVSDAAAYFEEHHDDEEILMSANADGFGYIPVGGMGYGAVIIDGEVWATNPYSYASAGGSKTTDASWGGSNDYSIGVTAENQPLVGLLRFKTTITNDTTGAEPLTLNGINRNTGTSSMIVYNQRFMNSPYYETVDTYMLVIEVENTAFGLSNDVTGTVREIYPEDKPLGQRSAQLDDHTIIVSASGSCIKSLYRWFDVGDKVTLRTRVTDQNGHNDLWQNVTDAISGHIIVCQDGKCADANLFKNNDVYAVTIGGFNNQGKLMFASFTADEECVYGGFTMGDVGQTCLDLGFNTCFFFDGGGSTTMIARGGDGELGIVSEYVDNYSTKVPEERRVASSVAVTWSAEPVCEAQGDLSYIRTDGERPVVVDPWLVRTAPDGRPFFVNAAGEAYYVDAAGAPTGQDDLVIDLSRVPGSNTFPNGGFTSPVIIGDINGNAYLGEFDLSKYNACYITYACDVQNDATGRATGSGVRSVAGLKKSETPYNGDGILVDLEDDIAHADAAPVTANWAEGARTIAVDLTNVDYSGDVYVGMYTQPNGDDYHALVISRVIFSTELAYMYTYNPSSAEKYEGPPEPETEPETEAPTEPETDPVTEPVTEAPTDPVTEPVTEPATDPATEAPSETPTEAPTGATADETDAPSDGGCSSALALALPLLPVLLASACVLKKKKD